MFKDEIKLKEWKVLFLILIGVLIIILSVYCDVDYVGFLSWYGELLVIEDYKYVRGVCEEFVGVWEFLNI